MKKKKIIIIIIGILIITACVIGIIVNFTKETFANETQLNPSITLSCDKLAADANDTLSCTINAKDFDFEVSSFRTKIDLGDNLSLIDCTINDSLWQGEGTDGIIDLYTDTNKTGNFELATFRVKTSEINEGFNTNIKLTNTYIGNANFEESLISTNELSIRIKSDINTLSNLSVSSVDLNYSRDKTTYEVVSESNTITINALKDDENSKITGDIGEHELNYGENNFSITVTSESGKSKTYTIKISRPDVLSFPDYINIENIDETNYIKNIPVNTTVAEMKELINTSGEITITNQDNEELKLTDKIGTGCKISIKLTKETKKYTVIILGDVNGDGTHTVTDVAKLFQHYRKTKVIPETEKYYILAGDVKQDNEIKLTDVAKLFQYIRGKIENLN